MRLRLYHHRDGARVAYRETGTGPPLALFHSLGLSYREWEPILEALEARFRVVLPDLPLHGDSEDRPRPPYTLEWMTDVIAGFCAAELGPRPLLAGHDLGGELVLRAATRSPVRPARLVLMPNRLHRRDEFAARRAVWRGACEMAALPGLDRLMARGAKLVFRPALGERLSAQGHPAARDLIRHAFADVGGQVNRARSGARFARRCPAGPQRDLLDAYPRLEAPVLLLWADQDPAHPVVGAQEALDLLPQAELRTLAGTGFLM